ncbi:M56 family metallopeptidase [Planctomycetota bacterium]
METSISWFLQCMAWLWRMSIQASILICLILFIRILLRDRLTIRWRYALWLLLLVRLSMPWAPQSPLSIYNLLPQWRLTAREVISPTEQTIAEPIVDGYTFSEHTYHDDTAPLDKETSPQSDGTVRLVHQQFRSPAESTTKTDVLGTPSRAPRHDVRKWLMSTIPVLSVAWLAGSVLLGCFVLLRNFNLWRAVKRERSVTDQEVLELLEDAKLQIGVQTILGVVITDEVKSPALFGFVRPRLLLPQGLLETLSLDELHHVLLHELAHLKRGDIYIGWWASLLQVLHWFNPLVWYAFRQLRTDQEMAADALALSRMPAQETRLYGETIVGLLERYAQRYFIPSIAGFLEDACQLERRMTMIAKFKKDSYRWSPLPVLLIVVIGCTSLTDMKGIKSSQTTAVIEKPSVTLRKLQPEHGDYANISPDGKYLCDEDWDNGNLIIRELITGMRWPVTENPAGDSSDSYTLWGAISPNSRHVAYLWYDSGTDSIDLYIVNLDGTHRRLLCHKEIAPRDWSADGTKILGTLYDDSEEENWKLVWVDAQDGSVEIIRDLGSASPNKFDISPDGRFLAFDHPQAENVEERDVFLMDLVTGHEKRIVEHAANDRLLGWTPNGGWILFASDRSDSWDAWLLRIQDSEPVDHPRLTKTNLGDIGAAGFASNGDYYFSIYDPRRNVYVAQFDPVHGKLLSSPIPLSPSDSSCEPAWSPDGQQIAYACKGKDGTSVIKIRSVTSGQEWEFTPDLPKRLIFWAPNGKALILSGFYEKWQNAVYSLDVQTGACSELLRHKDMSISMAQWFPDGKRLLYHGYQGPLVHKALEGYLIMRNMETGEEREIARGMLPGLRNYNWALSPDGRQLAVLFEGENHRLHVFSTETDEVNEIELGDLMGKPHQIVWAPEGKALFLRVVNLAVSRTSKLWCIPVDGGTFEKLSEFYDIPEPEYVMGMQIDPTGHHIALSAIYNIHELWVMKNFLSEEARR